MNTTAKPRMAPGGCFLPNNARSIGSVTMGTTCRATTYGVVVAKLNLKGVFENQVLNHVFNCLKLDAFQAHHGSTEFNQHRGPTTVDMVRCLVASMRVHSTRENISANGNSRAAPLTRCAGDGRRRDAIHKVVHDACAHGDGPLHQ